MATKKMLFFFVDEEHHLLGSDGVMLHIDGRKSIHTLKEELNADTHPNVRWAKKRGAIGYKLATGTILNPNYITELIHI